MTQQEVERWIAQNGGAGAVQFKRETRRVKNPLRDPNNPEYDDQAPEYATVEVLSWTNPQTGAALEVSPSGPGQYEIVGETGSKPSSAESTDRRTPEQRRQDEEDERERSYNAQQTGLRETHRERREREKAERAKPAAGPQNVPASPDQPYVVERDPATGELRATPNPNYRGERPAGPSRTIVKGEDGKTYVVSVDAQGTVTATDTGLPAKPKERQIVPGSVSRDPKTGKTTMVVRNPDDSLEQVEIGGKAGLGPLPEGVPQYQPDLGKPDLGRGERIRQLRELIRQGVITEQQAAAIIEDDYNLAASVADYAGDVATVQRDVYGTQVTQRGQTLQDIAGRRTAGQNVYSTALNALGPSFGRAEGGGALFVQALRELMQEGYRMIEQMGGLRERPEEPLPPFLQGMMEIQFPGGGPTIRYGGQPGAPGAPGPGMPSAPLPPSLQQTAPAPGAGAPAWMLPGGSWRDAMARAPFGGAAVPAPGLPGASPGLPPAAAVGAGPGILERRGGLGPRPVYQSSGLSRALLGMGFDRDVVLGVDGQMPGDNLADLGS